MVYFVPNTSPFIISYSQSFDFRACVSLAVRPAHKAPRSLQLEIALSLIAPTLYLYSHHRRLDPVVIALGLSIAAATRSGGTP
jgi:hypothetical protein